MMAEEGPTPTGPGATTGNDETVTVSVGDGATVSVPLTMMCSVCRERPAVAKKGTRRFLCVRCATGDVWYELVGPILADAPPPRRGPTASTEPADEALPQDPFAT